MIGNVAERPWTIEAVQELISLAREKVPAEIISLKLKRSVMSVREKLAELGVSAPATSWGANSTVAPAAAE
jgi:hypothetical protein